MQKSTDLTKWKPTNKLSFDENEYFNQGYSKELADLAGGVNEWQMPFEWDKEIEKQNKVVFWNNGFREN